MIGGGLVADDSGTILNDYALQFMQRHIAALLSTTALSEDEAEEHLYNAYRMAGLEPPHIRWFDSPAAFIEECSAGLQVAIEEYWPALYQFFREVFIENGLVHLALTTSMISRYPNSAWLVRKPSIADDACSVQYRDGWTIEVCRPAQAA